MLVFRLNWLFLGIIIGVVVMDLMQDHWMLEGEHSRLSTIVTYYTNVETQSYPWNFCILGMIGVGGIFHILRIAMYRSLFDVIATGAMGAGVYLFKLMDPMRAEIAKLGLAGIQKEATKKVLLDLALQIAQYHVIILALLGGVAVCYFISELMINRPKVKATTTAPKTKKTE